ncbi:MAG: hypothetical protein M3R25_12850, partial [Bacteroidota bacterium]|nr:hypothetical protein [Bacteroidota bacterium]
VTIACPGTPVFSAPAVTDNCDPNPAISFTDASNLDGCGTGTITRTYTAVDCANNNAITVSQTVTIEDTTIPILANQGADVTIQCPSSTVFTDPDVTDNCDPSAVITSTDASILDACGEGTVTRTWIATDCAGNVSIPVSQTITIEDTTSPVMTNQG